MGFSSEKYAVNASYGIAIIFYFLLAMLFQSIPFTAVCLFCFSKISSFIHIDIKAIILALIFFMGGSIASLSLRDDAYFVLPITYYFDYITVSFGFTLFIYVRKNNFRLTGAFLVGFAVLLAISIALHNSGLPRRAVHLLFDDRFSCEINHKTKLYALYDNFEGRTVISEISESCIWYYKEIDIARLSQNNRFGLLKVREMKYILPMEARIIGRYSDELFLVETDECVEYPSEYPDSYRKFCKTGYLNKEGKWIILPKYYISSDFENNVAAVGIVPESDPKGFLFLCIDRKEKILHSSVNSRDCYDSRKKKSETSTGAQQ